MSEQSTNGPSTSDAPSITSGVKEKPPKRVAAGKRLGAISKQARETKCLEHESQQTAQSEETEVDNKYSPYLVGGLVPGVAYYLYLNEDKLMGETKRLPTIPEEEEPPPKRKSKRIFDQ